MDIIGANTVNPDPYGMGYADDYDHSRSSEDAAWMEGAKAGVDVADVDLSTQDSTNFKGNKSAKKQVAEEDRLHWDNVDIMNQTTVADLLAMGDTAADLEKIANDVKLFYVSHYDEYAAHLHEVCGYDGQPADLGVECRKNIKADLQKKVVERWQKENKAAHELIAATLTLSREKLRQAYTNAFHCEHGCKCQFVDTTYKNLKKERADVEAKIAEA